MSEHVDASDLEALDLERMHEREREHRNLGWPVALSVGLVGAMILSMLLFLPMFGRNRYVVGLWDASPAMNRVTWQNEVWKPVGTVRTIPDMQMVAVERSNEGRLMYATKAKGATEGGGGGGKPETGAGPAEYGVVYLRRGTDQYQKLQLTNPGAPPVRPTQP